jgi:hypothetical protein
VGGIEKGFDMMAQFYMIQARPSHDTEDYLQRAFGEEYNRVWGKKLTQSDIELILKYAGFHSRLFEKLLTKSGEVSGNPLSLPQDSHSWVF